MTYRLLTRLILFMFLCVQGTLLAQITVTGKIVDATGPIPGVNVLVKGTQNGASSDFDGLYTLNNVAADAVLIFSYVGFQTQEIPVANQSVIDVTMSEDAAELAQVVVIGYGSVRKKDATGAVDAITAEGFKEIAAPSPAQLLQGKVSGVQVTQASGEPGSGVNIRVRGSASLRAGNNPLVVIDGVPIDGQDISPQGVSVFGASTPRNPLNFINQNDIESINILKDASATAIYGSRGANGVLLITTKRGKTDMPEVTFNSSFGLSTLSNGLDLLDSDEFVSIAANDPAINVNDFGARYNWEDTLLRTGFQSDNYLSVAHKTDRSRFRVSFGITTQEGIIEGTGLEKYTASLNSSTKYYDDKLTIDASVLVASLKDETEAFASDADFVGDLLSASLRWNPTRPLFQPNGSYSFFDEQSNLNPQELLDAYTDYTNTFRVLGSIAATLKLGERWKYKFMFGVDRSISERKNQLLPTFRLQDTKKTDPNGVEKAGEANIVTANNFSRIFENTLTYKNTFWEDLNVNLVLGYSFYDYQRDQNSTQARGFANSQTNLIDNIEGGIENQFRSTSSNGNYQVQSYFGRLNGDYKKLLYTLTLRVDGSSKFGENNRYGYFPSIGVGYKLIDDFEGVLSSLKVRGNWGITGNQEFDNYSSISIQRFGNNGSSQNTNDPNPDLKWEETESFGFGLDYGFFNGKITGSADYFRRITSNLLFLEDPALDPISPPGSPFFNFNGDVLNQGFEFSVTYTPVENENWVVDLSANAAYNDNEVRIPDVFLQTGFVNGRGLTGSSTQIIAEGEDLFNYYMLEFRGFDENGFGLYTGPNGDPVSINNANLQFIDAQPLPRVNFGFNTSVSYRDWDFTTTWYGVAGNYIYNNTANALFSRGEFNAGVNLTRDIALTNQDSGDPNTASSRFLEKGDFLRLSNVTLAYNFNESILKPLRLKSARMYMSASNLFVITNYSGFDPEVNTQTNFGGLAQFGIDYLSYPRAAGLTMGLNVTF